MLSTFIYANVLTEMAMKLKTFHITDALKSEIQSVKFPHWPKLGNDVYTNPISLISARFEGQTCLYGFTRPRCHTRTGHLLTLFGSPKTWLDRSQIPFMVHQESCEPSSTTNHRESISGRLRQTSRFYHNFHRTDVGGSALRVKEALCTHVTWC